MANDVLNVTHITAQPAGTVEVIKAISALEATNTPVAIPCAGAKKIGIQLTENPTVLNRSGVFTITASIDGGVSFQAYSMLLSNAANTNAQTLTRVASITRAAAGTDICWMTPETLGAITHIKATITITDGATPTGSFDAYITIQY